MSKKVIFVDVDDTLIRSFGAKRIPIPSVIECVKQLKAEDAELYLWSKGGAEYARNSALELGIADCFVNFLPKPL
jgi:predicted HAD superfamily phosphohydrolase YqeG